jgi:hypothetical protein
MKIVKRIYFSFLLITIQPFYALYLALYATWFEKEFDEESWTFWK